MSIAVGVVHGRKTIPVELLAPFTDESGHRYDAGLHTFDRPVALTPHDRDARFAIPDVTIGIGFHWERQERQVFPGALRIARDGDGLAGINDVALDDYVASVISSEMSAACPLALLQAHAVISRSWLLHPKKHPERVGPGNFESRRDGEIRRWYGREAHRGFDVCADDHCQRYQGVTKAFSPAAAQAVADTSNEVLWYDREVCDARFSKCCGGRTERYAAAWEDRDVPYLTSFYDGPGSAPGATDEEWIRGKAPAYCNTNDRALLATLLPGFDQETRNFYRWELTLSSGEIAELLRQKLGVDLGDVRDLEALERGDSGRITSLRISGEKGALVVGKELEIRRALSKTHLLSSAFLVTREGDRFHLRGAGWGHGVGLCQIGAAVMASLGRSYREILAHYYPGTTVAPLK